MDIGTMLIAGGVSVLVVIGVGWVYDSRFSPRSNGVSFAVGAVASLVGVYVIIGLAALLNTVG